MLQKLNDKIKVIAFDADDTLWVNEPNYVEVQAEVEKILEPYLEKQVMETKLIETERKNLHVFGYGAKGFALSLIETAIELSLGNITGKEIQKIIDLVKLMLSKPIELLEGIPEILDYLHPKYRLMIITKGDLFDQETKIARSGIADFFEMVEIVSEKNPETYRDILQHYNIKRDEFLMIGNSLKSDILPICAIGAAGIHIPYHTTWELEKVKAVDENLSYSTLNNASELMEWL